MKYDDNDINSIIQYAKQIEGCCLREKSLADDYNIKHKNKGQLGQLVEKYYFGYDLNSRQDADFSKVGLELKVCPVKKIKPVKSSKLMMKRKGLSAKERIVLTIIDYFKLAKENWNEATLHKKIKFLLMIYLYDNNVEVDEQQFLLINSWEPNKEDMLVIKEDWEKIQMKVRQGRAHEISEGDTMYLGACTKGSSKKDVKSQPFSDKPAMQRAFSFKRSYVDFIIEEILQIKEGVRKQRNVTEKTFSDRLLEELNKNEGISIKELIENYQITRQRKAKNYVELVTKDILACIFGKPVKDIEEFKKANIEIKCIVLQINDVPKESISFEQIKFTEIIEEEWYNSTMRNKFENKKHIWIIYKATKKYKKQFELKLNEIIFQEAFFWNMPIKDLDEDYQLLWKDTIHKIKKGDYDNFMNSKENRVGHIRPKGTNSKDLMLTIQGTYEKKKCFWLNAKYISSEIKRLRNTNHK